VLEKRRGIATEAGYGTGYGRGEGEVTSIFRRGNARGDENLLEISLRSGGPLILRSGGKGWGR